MKAQHERMGIFEESMISLGKAVIHGDKTDAGTGNLQKASLSYGRVLEVCVSCHVKFRD